MTGDWQVYCKAPWLSLAGEHIDVTVGGDRGHRVDVQDEGDAWLLMAQVATRATVAKVEGAVLRMWLKNRMTDLVGYRIDAAGRMVAEAWLPKAGATPEEFQTFVRALATESDRFEFQLSGKDRL